jgi:hypothetical protein
VVTDATVPVILPMLAVLGVVGVALVGLRGRQYRRISVLEIGMVYVAIVALYTLYPLLGFLVNGPRYTPFNGIRLFMVEPRPEVIGVVTWYHVIHLASFVTAYVLVRGKRSGEGLPGPQVGHGRYGNPNVSQSWERNVGGDRRGTLPIGARRA